MTKLNIKNHVGKELLVKVQDWNNEMVDANETEIIFQVACLAVKNRIGFSKELVLEATEFLYMELDTTPHLHFLQKDLQQQIEMISCKINDPSKLLVTLNFNYFMDANRGNLKKVNIKKA